MEQKIIALIKEYNLLTPHDRVIVAVSGGPDSLALLHWLMEIKDEWPLSLLVVHLNHQFRGKDADEDEYFVGQVCRKWGIPYISKRLNVASYAEKHKLNRQEAARECRYQFFKEVAQAHGYTKVALGHHADDQVETVLMRLIRGAGLAGLSGIPLVRETDSYTIVRPLLAVTKAEIEAYCREHQLEPRQDASNESDQYTRNYVRHHLLPHLVHLNPNVHKIVTEMTATLQEENEYIEAQTKQYFHDVVQKQTKEELTICLSSFLKVPLPLQRRLILLLLSYLPISRHNWNKIHIESVLNLLHSGEGYKSISLPEQVQVTKEYNQVHIGKQSFFTEKRVDAYQLELPSPGDYQWRDPNLYVRITNMPVEEDLTQLLRRAFVNVTQHTYIALFDADLLMLPLLLRNRKPGDRIQPLGMEGHQKVKDIFIDEKIPLAMRNRWPMLADQERLLWLPGLKRSNWAQVTTDTKHILKVEIKTFEEDLLRAR